jgi:hypothetical protein
MNDKSKTTKSKRLSKKAAIAACPLTADQVSVLAAFFACSNTGLVNEDMLFGRQFRSGKKDVMPMLSTVEKVEDIVRSVVSDHASEGISMMDEYKSWLHLVRCEHPYWIKTFEERFGADSVATLVLKHGSMEGYFDVM